MIQVPTHEFKNAITRCQKLVKKNTVKSKLICRMMYDSASESNTLQLSLNNYDVYADCFCPIVTSSDSLELLVDLGQLDLAMGFKENVTSINQEKNRASFTSGNKSFSVPTVSDEFSHYEPFIPYNTIIVDETLKTSLLKSCGFTAKDDPRAFLNAINLTVDSELARISATDGHRLCDIKHTNGTVGTDNNVHAMIPKIALESALSATSNDEMMLGFSENLALFMCSDFTYRTRLIEGSFPDVDLVIPKSKTNKFTFNTKEIQEEVKSALRIRECKMKIFIRGPELKINVFDPEGNIKGEFTTKCDNPDKFESEIGIDPKYLHEAMQKIDTEQFNFLIGSDRLSPFQIEPYIQEDMSYSELYIIMPMMV